MLSWGFTVDDALITARVAHHLSSGHGYVYNLGGGSTDAVTPLGWAWLVSLFASEGPWAAFHGTRAVGALATLLVTWLLGRALRASSPPTEVVVFLFAQLALSLPLGAWSSSGKEENHDFCWRRAGS